MDSTVLVYYKNAKNCFENKEYDEALNQIQNAINLENSCVDCWLLVCKIYLSLKKFQEASSSISTALNFDCNSAEAWHLRAKILLGLTRYNEALVSSNKSIELDKFNSEYLNLNENIKNFIKVRSTYDNPIQSNQEKPNIESKSKPKLEPDSEPKFKKPENYISDDFYNFNPLNKYSNMVQIIDLRNINLFKQKKFNSKSYYDMLDEVMKDAVISINKQNLNIFNKILELAKYFAEIEYKSEGEEYGLYLCNVIQVDNRHKTIEQISTIIHELAHHFLSEIFELSLMYIFDSVKTDAIESFAWFCITFKDEYLLMNEYCAHCVENYFMPYQYNNYESFNKVLKNFDLNNPNDIEKIKFATKLGNTFSQDIVYMLNKYIDDSLKKEIKMQYLVDGYMLYVFKGTKFKTKEFFDDQSKFNIINQILSETLVYVNTHFSILDLMNYKKLFNEANKKKKQL